MNGLIIFRSNKIFSMLLFVLLPLLAVALFGLTGCGGAPGEAKSPEPGPRQWRHSQRPKQYEKYYGI